MGFGKIDLTFVSVDLMAAQNGWFAHRKGPLCSLRLYFPHVRERLLKKEAKRERTYFYLGCVLAGDSFIGQMHHSSGVE